MSQRSAVDELTEYIDHNDVEESVVNISHSMKRHEFFGRVSVPLSSCDSSQSDLEEFMSRLKQTETFRRRFHRNLRRNLNRDYDSNLIDLFDLSSMPPPPPPLLLDDTIETTVNSKLERCDETLFGNSYNLRRLEENVKAVLSAPAASISFDESVCETTTTIPPLGRSERSHTSQLEGATGDLMIALCKRRRQKHDQELLYLLGLNSEDDDNEKIEGIR